MIFGKERTIMIKNIFSGIKLPSLGLGCMRLPVDGDREISTSEVKDMVAYAMEHGVNYFDTGYDYHGGKSETVMGDILSEYDRESFYLADKFPGYSPRNWRRVKEIFEEQLLRCRVDYFDFYLFHNLSELNVEAYLDPKYGIFDYLIEQKNNVRIKHLGFSAHGSVDTIRKFLDAYGDHMEFGQLQINYIDYEFQHAKEKIELLDSYSIPVWVMEPLRGGKLVTPPSPFDSQIKEVFPNLRTHEVAFSFVRSIPSVKLTLSGMSNMEQLKDNIEIFSKEQELSSAQFEDLVNIARRITAVGTVPCTSCRYCTEECPMGLDIPLLIEYYNEHTFSGGGFIVPSAVASLPRDKRPTACIGCRHCEAVCPQSIKIADVLTSLSDKLGLKKPQE